MIFIINLFFLATFIPIGILFYNFKMRCSPIVSVIIFIFGGLVCSAIERYVTHSSPLLFPLLFLCTTVALFMLFSITFKTALLFVLSSYFAISLLYLIVETICIHLPIPIIVNNSFISGIITFLISLSLSILINIVRNRKYHLTLLYLPFFSIVISIDGIVLIAIGIFLFTKMKITNIPLGLFIYLLLIAGILIQVFLLVYMIKSRDLHKENELLAKQYLENQTRYYEYLAKRDEDTKKFRHDIRNHISMLNMLFNENKIDDCKDYLKDLTNHYENIHNIAVTINNCIADAILNKYYYEAMNYNITLNVSGRFPAECNLSAYDICTIFSNLLENALKAVISCNGKTISIGCRYNETDIFLSFENDSDYIKLDSNGMPHTSKADISQHGFGLKNVQQCVLQNNGHMYIQSEGKCFKVMLSLNRGINNENCNNR